MDRTTVDALKALGKALCGDSFEVTPGLTDAEMIFEIAKQYEAPEGGGGDDGSGGGEGGTGLRELVIDENRVVHGTTWDEITAEFLEPTTDIFGLFTVKRIDLDNNVPYAYQLGSVWRLTSCVYNGDDASTGVYKVCAASIDMDYGYTQDGAGEGVYCDAISAGIEFTLHENQLYAQYSLSGTSL